MQNKLKWIIGLILIIITGFGIKYAYYIDKFNFFINNIELYINKETTDKYKVNKSFQKNRKININEAEFKQLSNIKYLSRDDAINILMFRELNGKIKSFDEILEITSIKEEHIQKIKRQIYY